MLKKKIMHCPLIGEMCLGVLMDALVVFYVVQHTIDVRNLARIQQMGAHCTCRLERAPPGSLGGKLFFQSVSVYLC